MKKLIAILVITLVSIRLTASAANPDFVQENYLNSVKITFLSWTSGSTKVAYERALPNWHQSGELCASLISAGYDKYSNDPLGFTLRYGHKFFINQGDIALKGFYLRPEFIYSHYNYTCTDTGLHGCKASGAREKAAMGALLGTFGYQYCIGHFIADAWVGGGYAFGTPAETGYHHGFQLWNWFGTKNNNIALSFSIRLGFVW